MLTDDSTAVFYDSVYDSGSGFSSCLLNVIDFDPAPCSDCCGLQTAGFTGNVDCSDDSKRNLTDITRLIDRVYVSKGETAACF